MEKMERLSNTVKDLVLGGGAVAAGIVRNEDLEGGPPSTDLSYMLQEAKSAVVFAVPIDQSVIEPFFKKEDMGGMNIVNRRVNTMASGIALELAEYLNMKGYASVPVTANAVYRKDVPGGPYTELPPISHRYLAVRSGIGHFGLSGNVIMAEYGHRLSWVLRSPGLNSFPPIPCPKRTITAMTAVCARQSVHPG